MQRGAVLPGPPVVEAVLEAVELQQVLLGTGGPPGRTRRPCTALPQLHSTACRPHVHLCERTQVAHAAMGETSMRAYLWWVTRESTQSGDSCGFMRPT